MCSGFLPAVSEEMKGGEGQAQVQELGDNQEILLIGADVSRARTQSNAWTRCNKSRGQGAACRGDGLV